jgi:hypothetical protein
MDNEERCAALEARIAQLETRCDRYATAIEHLLKHEEWSMRQFSKTTDAVVGMDANIKSIVDAIAKMARETR